MYKSQFLLTKRWLIYDGLTVLIVVLSGTTREDEYPCPLGTFNNMTGLNNTGDCTPCSGGYYCGSTGLSEPTAQCSAGYYCVVSAETAAPTQGADADICPQGKI